MSVDFALKGKRVVVTGGSRGIGRGIAVAAARAGANVITCHRKGKDAVRGLEDALAETAGDHRVVEADVSDPHGTARLLAEAQSHFGGLDVLVNNVGEFSPQPYAELTDAGWGAAVEGNLTSAHRLIHGALALDLLPSGSSIVNLGSIVTFIGMAGGAHYTAGKAGLVGMTRSLARELGPRNIRVNVVSPGRIDTEAFDAMPPEVAARQRAMFSQMSAVKRLGTVEEIANVVLFLASDLASYITGQDIHADGCV